MSRIKRKLEGVRCNQETKYYDTDLWYYNETFFDYTEENYIGNPSNQEGFNFVCNPRIIDQQTNTNRNEFGGGLWYSNGNPCYQLNRIDMGKKDFERIGREIWMESVSLKLQFMTGYNKNIIQEKSFFSPDQFVPQTVEYQQNQSQSGIVRAMLIYDKQPINIGATIPEEVNNCLNPQDVLKVPERYIEIINTVGGNDELQGQGSMHWNTAHLNLFNGHRFEILMDELITLNSYGSGENLKTINKYIELKNRRTVYCDKYGSNINSGVLWLMVLSDQGEQFITMDDQADNNWSFTFGADYPKFWWNGTSRIRYSDTSELYKDKTCENNMC